MSDDWPPQLIDLPAMVWGKTEVENHRHVEARAIVGDLLIARIEKQNIHLDWLVSLGLAETAVTVAALADQLRALPQGTSAAALARMETSYREAFWAFVVATLNQSDALVALARHYVEGTVNRQWDWLVDDLCEKWTGGLLAYVTAVPVEAWDEAVTLTYRPPMLVPPSPFVRHEGETKRQADRRRKREERAHKKTVAEKAKARKGYGYPQDVNVYAEYWFRRVVGKEAWNRIALYDEQGQKRDELAIPTRLMVKKRVAMVEQWLSVGFTEENWRKSLEAYAQRAK